MITFTDTKQPSDVDIVANDTEKIKPLTSVGPEDSKAYWDSMFRNNIVENYQEVAEFDLSETEILEEIFSKSEDDFSFPYDVDKLDLANLLKEFDEENWMDKTDEDKMLLVDELVNAIGVGMLDLQTIPNVELFQGETYELGAYVYPANRVEINKDLLNKPKELVNTLTHEMRHAYQHQRATMLESKIDYLYKYNFEHYIAPDEFFLLYQDQLVESEARAFASLFDQKGVS